jgi:O-antigen/teichoic acid export membrane protein
VTLSHFLRLAMGVGAINLAERAIGIVLGVILARWLGPEGYGTYAFVMAWAVILNIPAQFGLPDLLMRDLAMARSDSIQISFRALLQRSVRLVLVFSILTTTVALAFTLASPLAGVLVISPTGNLKLSLIIGFFGLPILALLGVFGAALRGLGRPLATQVFSSLLPTIMVLLLTMGSMTIPWQGNDAEVALLCRFLGLGVALIAAMLFLQFHLRRPETTQIGQLGPVRETLKSALPFMMLTGAFIIMSRTDVVMIGILASQREVGLFNAGLQAAVLSQFGLSVSNSIVAPEFARLHANGEEAQLQYLAVSTARIVLLFGLAILAILSLFGNSLLGLMFGAEFHAAYSAMLILVIGQSVALIFGEPGFLLNMTGNQTLTLRLVSGTALLNIALNAILIPLAGIEGAAMSTSIALVTWRALGYMYVRRRLGINCAAFGRASRKETV